MENHDYGKDLGALIQVREKAAHDLRQAEKAIANLGAKVFMDGNLHALPNLDVQKYIDCQNQEFAWEATMEDGSFLMQFEKDGTQHHFGDIDQANLCFLAWISNFEQETSNKDRRVIVSLDFHNRHISVLNGRLDQETRAALDANPMPLGAKLILKMVKRQSFAPSYTEANLGHTTLFNRYLLGWESADKKFLVCVEPNGLVHLWHHQE